MEMPRPEWVPANAIPVYKESALWFWMDGDTCEELRPPAEEVSWEQQVAEAHAFADRQGEFAKCYFVGGDEGAIKIGYSVAPADRLEAIRMHSPIPVRILALAPGGKSRESAYHFQFAEHRLHGEWFARHADILSEIERLNARPARNLVLDLGGHWPYIRSIDNGAMPHLARENADDEVGGRQERKSGDRSQPHGERQGRCLDQLRWHS